MFTNDRGGVPHLFGGTVWRTSGWCLVELVERRGFVCLFFIIRIQEDDIKGSTNILEFITFYQNALPQCILAKSDLTRVYFANFYQSALRRYGLHEDVTPSSREDSNEKSMNLQVCGAFSHIAKDASSARSVNTVETFKAYQYRIYKLDFCSYDFHIFRFQFTIW